MKIKIKNGFTLIELLVVIAILGILSSVILFSVAQYIGKSKDANVVGNLAVLVSAGEVYYNSHSNNYEDFCGSSVLENAISDMPSSGGDCYNALGTQGDSSNKAGICCYDSEDAWAACAPKFFDNTKAYCVDNRGVKKEISVDNCVSGLTKCPN